MRFLLLIIILAFSTLFSQQLPNMDFEEWEYNSLSKSFTTLKGPWDTGNACYPDYSNGGIPDTICSIFVTQQSDAVSGTKSLKIQTPTNITPGLGGLTTYNSDEGNQYMPFQFTPMSLKVYYKYFKGLKSDEGSVTVNFYDDNLSTILYGVESIFDERSSWTPFTVDLSKIPPTSTPKYVEIIFKHVQDPTESTSRDTYLMLDNLSFIYSVDSVLDEAIKNGFQYSDGIMDISRMPEVNEMLVHSLVGDSKAKIIDRFDTHNLKNGIYLMSYLQKDQIKSFKIIVNN